MRHSLVTPLLTATVLLLAREPLLPAQQQSAPTLPAASATPVPLSSPSMGGVNSGVMSLPNAPGSVNVSRPTLQIQAPYSGSTTDPKSPAVVTLTLREAVSRGIRLNFGMTSATASQKTARAQKKAAFSELLPHISGSLAETGAKLDMEAEGLSSSTFGSTGLGAAFPTTVGPFHYYSLQGNVSATVLNFTSLYNYRGAAAGSTASDLSSQDARELVVLAVTGQYMQVLGTQAQVAAQAEQVQYAEASYRQAKTQADAGTKADVDAFRSLVQLQTEQQRLKSEQNDLNKETFALARILGLPVSTKIILSSVLNEDATIPVGAEEAVTRAIGGRKDLKAMQAQVTMAEMAVKAAHSEHLPTAAIQGYYGLQGVNPNRGTSVFQATATVSIPVFEGGKIQSDVEQAKASLDQHRASLENQRGEVELEVRNAYADLELAVEQVQVAKSNRELALKTYQQSQDRFSVGATTSVEVVQSEQALGNAANDYVAALYAQNLSRITLARAMGDAEQQIQTLLKDK